MLLAHLLIVLLTHFAHGQPSEFALNQKLCFKAQLGFEYIRKTVDKMFHQYILRYNVHYPGPPVPI